MTPENLETGGLPQIVEPPCILHGRHRDLRNFSVRDESGAATMRGGLNVGLDGVDRSGRTIGMKNKRMHPVLLPAAFAIGKRHLGLRAHTAMGAAQ